MGHDKRTPRCHVAVHPARERRRCVVSLRASERLEVMFDARDAAHSDAVLAAGKLRREPALTLRADGEDV